MLISKTMNAAINAQIGREFGAEMQYVQIASYFDGEGLPMLARHFFRQAEEERGHAMKFVRHLLDADGEVAVPTIAAPQPTFASAEEAVQKALDWEVEVTRQINEIVDLAVKERDHITKGFLDWFTQEQLEEVSSMETLLRMVRRAGEQGLLFVENYLAGGHRVGDGGAGPRAKAEP
jgi:ferritin